MSHRSRHCRELQLSPAHSKYFPTFSVYKVSFVRSNSASIMPLLLQLLKPRQQTTIWRCVFYMSASSCTAAWQRTLLDVSVHGATRVE
jgi:hypothetical protein